MGVPGVVTLKATVTTVPLPLPAKGPLAIDEPATTPCSSTEIVLAAAGRARARTSAVGAIGRIVGTVVLETDDETGIGCSTTPRSSRIVEYRAEAIPPRTAESGGQAARVSGEELLRHS